eukprot:TRINITY_DN302_c0_g1_i13.p3 TRINITY_DN302_c0_g1~~TRINITY_DN302_c0_g1_i13.p3  ORF type:complete len:118 (+),score=41.33 TRINITY_DN302_c0_g1_i13:191-544(+)
MTADCLSCSAGVSKARYCRWRPSTVGCSSGQYCRENPNTVGCSSGVISVADEAKEESREASEQWWWRPKACCRAFTAACMSCQAGLTEAQYCAANPHVVGCQTEAQYCRENPNTVGC